MTKDKQFLCRIQSKRWVTSTCKLLVISFALILTSNFGNGIGNINPNPLTKDKLTLEEFTEELRSMSHFLRLLLFMAHAICCLRRLRELFLNKEESYRKPS